MENRINITQIIAELKLKIRSRAIPVFDGA